MVESSPRRQKNRDTHEGCPYFLVEAAGLDSRANCALGLPRSRTSTGSPLYTVSPSSPLHNKAKEDIPQGHIFFYLVEAAGLEPTVSSTRNWRDTTFATPRRIIYPNIITQETRFVKWFWKKTLFCAQVAFLCRTGGALGYKNGWRVSVLADFEAVFYLLSPFGDCRRRRAPLRVGIDKK